MLRLYCYGELPADVGDVCALSGGLRAGVRFGFGPGEAGWAEGYWLGGVAQGEMIAADTPYHPLRALLARFRSWGGGAVERLLARLARGCAVPP
jgi:hypothetical protein